MTKPRTARTKSPKVNSLQAYLQRNGRALGYYIYLQTGKTATAREIMKDLAAELGVIWDHVLEQPMYDAYVWKLVKSRVARWLKEHGQDSRMAEASAFRKAGAWGRLLDLQVQFTALETDLGLYIAIGKLTERQYDVIVLRYVLTQEIDDIAGYMGVGKGTVYSTINQAKNALLKSPTVAARVGHSSRHRAPGHKPQMSSTPNSGNE